jgi:hypothetical protein
MKIFTTARVFGAALVIGAALPGLAFAQGATPDQQQGQAAAPTAAPTQQATMPTGGVHPNVYNPNQVPIWSNLRNGDGDPVDPTYGTSAPGYGGNQGGGY